MDRRVTRKATEKRVRLELMNRWNNSREREKFWKERIEGYRVIGRNFEGGEIWLKRRARSRDWNKSGKGEIV